MNASFLKITHDFVKKQITKNYWTFIIKIFYKIGLKETKPKTSVRVCSRNLSIPMKILGNPVPSNLETVDTHSHIGEYFN